MKRVKRLAAWMVWVGLSLMSGCIHPPPPWEPNPNLRLVISKANEEGCEIYSPVWGDGKIYYILGPWLTNNRDTVEIRTVNEGGKGDRKICSLYLPRGPQGFLDISPDLSRLLTWADIDYRVKFYIIDTSGITVESLQTDIQCGYNGTRCGKARFNSTGEKIFFSIDSLLVSIDIASGTVETLAVIPDGLKDVDPVDTGAVVGEGIGVGGEGFYYLDLSDYTMEYLSGLTNATSPRINPSYTSLLVHSDAGLEETVGGGIGLYDMVSKESFIVDARPYEWSASTRDASWSPNGQSVVFACGRYDGGGYSPCNELWIFDNIVEEISK